MEHRSILPPRLGSQTTQSQKIQGSFRCSHKVPEITARCRHVIVVTLFHRATLLPTLRLDDSGSDLTYSLLCGLLAPCFYLPKIEYNASLIIFILFFLQVGDSVMFVVSVKEVVFHMRWYGEIINYFYMSCVAIFPVSLRGLNVV